MYAFKPMIILQRRTNCCSKSSSTQALLKQSGIFKFEGRRGGSVSFCPIFNPSYVSELIKKAVAWRLHDHIVIHHLHKNFQSVYKRFHSTDTALISVQNDILTVVDTNNCYPTSI